MKSIFWFFLVWRIIVLGLNLVVKCFLVFLISIIEAIELYMGGGVFIKVTNRTPTSQTSNSSTIQPKNMYVLASHSLLWSVYTDPEFLSWKYNIPKLPNKGLGVLNSCDHACGWEEICATRQLSTGSSFEFSHPNCIIPNHWSLTDLERIIHIQLTAAIFTSRSNAWFYSFSRSSNPFKSKAISDLTKLSDIAIESVTEKSWPCNLMTNSKSENGRKSRACLLGRNKGGLSLSSWTLLSPCGSVIEKRATSATQSVNWSPHMCLMLNRLFGKLYKAVAYERRLAS